MEVEAPLPQPGQLMTKTVSDERLDEAMNIEIQY